ncbi:DUF1294 domain-containing protein [Sulfitobacter sp.]|uniref:DUF1294 domain-containing protein n=1 Tax=Sulfitobacter sp. TaxID=1903071 RepID=UPI00329A699C
MIFLAIALCYFVLINWLTYSAFAVDKRRAIAKEWRIPERRLLGWAAMGGWFGAKYAQQKLRHKSYKQPFGRHLNEIGFIQGITAATLTAVFAALLIIPLLFPATPAAVQAAQIAAPAAQPDPVPPLKSLRPPVGYRAGS